MQRLQRFKIVLSNKDYVNVLATDIESLMAEISRARDKEGSGYMIASNSEDKKVYINSNHINMIIPLAKWERRYEYGKTL